MCFRAKAVSRWFGGILSDMMLCCFAKPLFFCLELVSMRSFFSRKDHKTVFYLMAQRLSVLWPDAGDVAVTATQLQLSRTYALQCQ